MSDVSDSRRWTQLGVERLGASSHSSPSCFRSGLRQNCEVWFAGWKTWLSLPVY